MAEPAKSAVFVDYDSLQRSLADAGLAETRLADRAAAWVGALEKGRLIGPRGTRRRFVLKRCYAGSGVLGKQRDALAAAGFEVIDTSPQDGTGGSADLHLAMDTLDALMQPNGAEEFVLLAASVDLGPLLTRLKASKRQTVIYADGVTSARDKALADGILSKTDLAEFLASEEQPEGEAMSSSSVSDRAEIEAFARRVHGATNIPLFSPKTFAELFKHLTDEIKENGYHFQSTARHVADRMTATGRNVTRRQVMFIVKGLALKGHVFSNDDTPDDLAEVFREQARYLITNAGMTLDPRQDQLLNAWFVSRAPATPARPRPPGSAGNGATPPAPQAAPPGASPAPAPQMPAGPPPSRPADIRVRTPEKAPTAPPPPPPVAPAVAATKPSAPAVKPVELPKAPAKTPPQQPPPIRLSASPAAREEAKAIIAARIAASAKLKSGASKNPPGKPSGKSGDAKPSRPAPPAAQPKPDPNADALESSILAAIAEAVDVLVDDRGGEHDEVIVPEPQTKRKAPQQQSPPEAPPPPPARAQAAQEEEDDSESGDIGDQIQRIIASYNRNRNEDE